MARKARSDRCFLLLSCTCHFFCWNRFTVVSSTDINTEYLLLDAEYLYVYAFICGTVHTLRTSYISMDMKFTTTTPSCQNTDCLHLLGGTYFGLAHLSLLNKCPSTVASNNIISLNKFTKNIVQTVRTEWTENPHQFYFVGSVVY